MYAGVPERDGVVSGADSNPRRRTRWALLALRFSGESHNEPSARIRPDGVSTETQITPMECA
jgi:hypothetical protein